MGDRRGKANICLYVDPELKRDFQEFAKQDGRSMTNFITQVLLRYRNEMRSGMRSGSNANMKQEVSEDEHEQVE